VENVGVRLKLTLSRSSGSNDDVVVVTEASALVSDVARTIADTDPLPEVEFPSEQLVTLRTLDPVSGAWATLPGDAAIGEGWLSSGGRIALADAGPAPVGKNRGPAAARLDVLSGPDAGVTYSLPWGTSVIGRNASCDVVLSDRAVSGRHLRVEVSDVIEIIDEGSANGTIVDGGFINRLTLHRSEDIAIGGTTIRLTKLVATPPAESVRKHGGPAPFTRSPRVEKRYPGEEYVAPDVPVQTQEQPFPWLAMIAPILLGVAMAVIFQRPAALLFVVMSPLMIIGNSVMSKKRDKRALERSVARFEEQAAVLRADLQRERDEEITVRCGEAPSTDEVYRAALARESLLWTRRPEHWSFLNIRLGSGRMRSRTTIELKKRGEMIPEFQERADALAAEFSHVEGVPVVDNPAESGALGLAGMPAAVAPALNAILVQISGLHSPAELLLTAVVSPDWSEDLEWIKWLPHTSSPQSPLGTIPHLTDSVSSAGNLVSALEDLVQQRIARKSLDQRGATTADETALERGAEVGVRGRSGGFAAALPAIVVLLAADAPVDRARLVQLSELGADAGVFPIWLASSVGQLPAVCRTTVEIPGLEPRATVSFVRLGEVVEDVVIDTVDAAAAAHYGRSMAPVVDSGALVADSSDIPRAVAMTTLLGNEVFEAADAVVDRWVQNLSIHDRTPGAEPTPRSAGTLRAIVGSAGIDALHLDLRGDGPHALVGGTTGAGKSEFLQAWVLGMATEYSPDRVTFLFVDYKGGSAFADCLQLPHCVGLVTDLSPHLVRRALTSLRAELHYREHLFNRKEAKDLLDLEKRGDPEAPPALVIVIDEFAALVKEVPEFVDGVVDIAQRGRSLGIHLIMATQRPAGVIKDNLRANTNLRVALRMADEADSLDVVGTPEAAHFDPAIPGRAIAKTGPGRLRRFQSGYAGGWTTASAEKSEVSIVDLRFGGVTPWSARHPVVEVQATRGNRGPTDQQRLVSAVSAAASSAGIPAPRRPWLDELPATVELRELLTGDDAEIVFGLSDVPAQQRRAAAVFRPDADGHLAIYGTGGSGKTVTLRSLAAAVAHTPHGGPVAVYGLDFAGGGLRMLEALQHVGSVITPDDTERIVRLLRMLRDEMEARRERYAAAASSTIAEYRTATGSAQEPRILLLVDGFPAFREDWELTPGRVAWYDVFRDVLTGGRQLGIHVAFTADRYGAVPSSVSSSVQCRVVLRLADEAAYALLDAPKDVLDEMSAPGRAVVAGLETQIAALASASGGMTSADQAVALEELAASLAGVAVAAASIAEMPKEYGAEQAPAEVDGLPTLGISDEDLRFVGFEPTGAMILSGPPASGRSSALRAITHALRRHDAKLRLFYLGNARSGIAEWSGWTTALTRPDEVAVLAKELAASIADGSAGRVGIIIESITEFLQTPADAALLELVRQVKRHGGFLLAEAEVGGWAGSWPLAAELKSGRRGLLLQPDPMEGELLLKTPIPRANRSEYPPGRGMYVARGKAVRVQLPLVAELAESIGGQRVGRRTAAR
jgi:S-DNA-T family DNA segregation ATPase FtsK/SpoIIIE